MPTELLDDSPMPFGKHIGKPLSTVPATYLVWLWNRGCEHPALYRYIQRNIDLLLLQARGAATQRKKQPSRAKNNKYTLGKHWVKKDKIVK